MSLIIFLADLMRDPQRQEAFARDPRRLMKQSGLDDAEIELVWSEDKAGIGAAVAQELADFASAQRLPYPSSTVKVTAISPASAAAGTTVQARVDGLFFDAKATCSLRSGQDEVVGKVLDVQSSFHSSLTVSFDVPADADPGKWSVRVSNAADHYDTLPQAFEITDPAADA